ncbi:cysteine-rich with EGF-like domain protein 2 isoform X1 [Mya arenaria]|uniref:cysteine-rich with EGF-like domain protein 2 isoform X1 n=1 Tax=Mya arenaria TaxID=6604 RepID=UPI0022DFC329|nr:cysteine-rich with EGF-like domain protein 2 isoform X1 [Mya arenaria]
MNLQKIVISALLHLNLIIVLCAVFGGGVKEKCDTCKDIVENFKEGLEKTRKSNFGGGNTHWEEKSLGTWAHSETRLIEIWENYLCKGDAKECHFMLEKHEEDIENFWFKVHAKNEQVDMHQWFCVDRIKVCCPSNSYGPKCLPCAGGNERPCKGNGKCNGEGTREGTGKCECDSGYQGDLCDECTDHYFEESKNDTHTSCTACHTSCKTTCWEAGPKGCDECKNGWKMSEENGCEDVNECDDTPCEENQYCSNTEGSYNCATCHRSCTGCTGYGANRCVTCKGGYQLQDEHCLDINECTEDTTLCSGEKQSCHNTDGSYECKCEDNMIYEEGGKICIPKPKDPSKAPKSKEKKKKEHSEKDRPGLLILLGMLVVFYVCGSIVQWNFIIVFFLSIVFGVFLFWFGSQHEYV